MTSLFALNPLRPSLDLANLGKTCDHLVAQLSRTSATIADAEECCMWKGVVPRLILISLVGSGGSPRVAEAAVPNKFGNRTVHVLCVQFVGTPNLLPDCDTAINLLNQHAAPWFFSVSDEQVNLVFAPIPIAPPAAPPANGFFPIVDPNGVGLYIGTYNQVVAPVVNQTVSFVGVDELVVVSAGNASFGQAPGTSESPNVNHLATTDVNVTEAAREFDMNDKPTRKVAMAIVGEWAASGGPPNEMRPWVSTYIHERGHLHQLFHSYETYVVNGHERDYTTGYTPMGGQWYDFPPTALSVHYLAYQQWWTNFTAMAAPKLTVGKPTANPAPKFTVVPATVRNPPQGVYSLLLVPVGVDNAPTLDNFRGYALECRTRREQGVIDDRVLQSGLVVLWVDMTEPEESHRIRVIDDPDSPGDLFDAAFEEGDTIEDPARGVMISAGPQVEDACDVTVANVAPGDMKPDLMVTPWDENWVTPDIWVDAPSDGFNPNQNAYDPNHDDVPEIRADPTNPPIVNRIHVRVKNVGVATANGYSVKIFAAPPGVQQQNWTYLGTKPLAQVPVGDTQIVRVDWQIPEAFAGSQAHGCIHVEIITDGSDSNPNNNQAQENIFHFETVHNSPWHSRGRTISVTNTSTVDTAQVAMYFSGLPFGWAIRLDPYGFALPPGGTTNVEMELLPAGTPSHPAPEYDAGYYAAVRIGAQLDYFPIGRMPYSRPAGGVTAGLRLTNSTQLSLSLLNVSGTSATVKACLETTTGQPIPGQVVGVQYARAAVNAWVVATTLGTGCATVDVPGLSTGVWTVIGRFAGNGTLGTSSSSPITVVVP